MSKLKAPKKWLNATLFYFGCFGLVFHLTAIIYGLWIGLGVVTNYWWTWPAPIVCILWGILPPLQLQAERHSKEKYSTFEV